MVLRIMLSAFMNMVRTTIFYPCELCKYSIGDVDQLKSHIFVEVHDISTAMKTLLKWVKKMAQNWTLVLGYVEQYFTIIIM